MASTTVKSRHKFSLSRFAGQSTRAAIIVTVGLLVALLAGSLATREARWIVYLTGAIIVSFVFLIAGNKRRVLEALFVLSLQFDVSYRLFYGHAGSAGIAIPLAAITGGALAVWSVLSRQGSRTSMMPLGTLGPLIAAYFAFSGVSLLVTTERFVGLSHLVFELELFLVYWLGLTIARNRKGLDRVVQLLILTLVIQSVVYIVQHVLGISFSLIGQVAQRGSLPRPGGTVDTTPAGFASFILPALMLAVVTFLAAPGDKRSTLRAAVVLLGFSSLILTLTRAAYASAAVGSVAIAWLSHRRGLLQPRRLLYLASGAAAITLVLLPLILTRLEASPTSGAYQERLGLMKVALHIIHLHPWAGLGPGAYAQTFSRYIPETLPPQWLAIVHNAYLLRTAETGILGGITLIALLIGGVRLGVRASRTDDLHLRWIAIGLTSGVIALSFEMSWDTWRGFTYNAMLWFILGLVDATHRLTVNASPLQLNTDATNSP